MTARNWAYLIGTCIVAGLGVFVAADLESVGWSDLAAPKYVLGSVMAMGVAIVNYFKPNPK